MGFLGEIIDEIKGLAPGKKDLRNLGLVFLAALSIIGGLLLWKGRGSGPYWIGAGLLFGLWGLVWPAGLKPVYKVWMSLAVVLGFFVSRLLLAIIFYLVVTPIGLIMRLLGKDLLDIKLKDRDSYWHVRSGEYDPKRTEKMY
jgi:hypothetical protein